MTERAPDHRNDPAGGQPPRAPFPTRPDLSVILRVGADVTGLARALGEIRQQPVLPLEIIVIDQMAAGHVSAILARFRDLPVIHVVHSAASDEPVGGYRLGLGIARGDRIALPREAAPDGPARGAREVVVLSRAEAARLLEPANRASGSATRARLSPGTGRRPSRTRGRLPLLPAPLRLS